MVDVSMDFELVPEKNVAEMLGLTVEQLRRKIKHTSSGPVETRIGRSRYYTRDDIRVWLESCRGGNKKQTRP